MARSSAGDQRDLLGETHRLAVAGAAGTVRAVEDRPPAVHRWAADGTWVRLKAHVIALAELDDDIDWDAQVDSTIVRTHQHAAGAKGG